MIYEVGFPAKNPAISCIYYCWHEYQAIDWFLIDMKKMLGGMDAVVVNVKNYGWVLPANHWINQNK